eukprot:6866919-Prymnesium_polylepis.1
MRAVVEADRVGRIRVSVHQCPPRLQQSPTGTEHRLSWTQQQLLDTGCHRVGRGGIGEDLEQPGAIGRLDQTHRLG